jgi:NAD(P)-dependent dehydrogenase (short-subunit alcohol dehydrogenase family)
MTAAAMDGQVCVVTGATAGLGRAIAADLATRGATLVLVGRDAARGAAAVDTIRRDSGNGSIAFLAADLSSLADVRALAAAIVARHPRLHLLVNNAGALFARRTESVDGLEMTLALNHVGPFLLTNLLLDALRAGLPSRVVNIASAAHRDVDRLDLDDPQARRSRYPRGEPGSAFYALALPMAHPGFRQYARSKLANVQFTVALARRLAGRGVSVHAVDPGVVATGFGAGNGLYGWFLQRQFQRRGMPAGVAARAVVNVATAPELAAYSGGYFAGDRPEACSPAGYDLAAGERLWDLSETLAGLR